MDGPSKVSAGGGVEGGGLGSSPVAYGRRKESELGATVRGRRVVVSPKRLLEIGRREYMVVEVRRLKQDRVLPMVCVARTSFAPHLRQDLTQASAAGVRQQDADPLSK